MSDQKSRRVHFKKSDYDIYIGRPSKWGNPFSSKEGSLAEFIVETRKESLEKHKEWILKQSELLSELETMKGKVLGCWCDEGKKCHGDILVEIINNGIPKKKDPPGEQLELF